ncbi:MAG: VOC family protein [Pseudobdellovibrionaceae bacterium]
MKTKSIAAVMVHVPDSKAGLEWYTRAFPEATRVHLPEFEFECLNINGINLEIVPSDEKVGHGPVGVAVDWLVEDFDQALNHLIGLGATLYRGPGEIENGWKMCKMKDPFGNLIGLRGP